MESGDLPVQGLGTVAASQGCPVRGQNEGAKGQSQHSLHSVTAGWLEPVRAVGSAAGWGWGRETSVPEPAAPVEWEVLWNKSQP